MRNLIAATLLASAAAAAFADTAEVGGLSYSSVTVTDVRGAELVMRLSGRELTKPIGDVTLLSLEGKAKFNEAERLLKAGKSAEAAKAYDAAAKEMPLPWQGRLLRLRQLKAQDAAGMTVEAVKSYLAILDENKTLKLSGIRPGKFGAKGSPQNAKAIEIVQAKLKELGDKKSPQREALEELLAEIQVAEGLAVAAPQTAPSGTGNAASTTAVAAAGSEPAPTGTRAPAAPTAVSPSVSQELAAGLPKLAAKLPTAPQEVASQVQANILLYAEKDLPAALLLSAKAQSAMAAKAPSEAERKDLLTAAGLDAMRVVAAFPRSEQAGECLLVAAEASAALGNKTAAVKAYEAVVAEYPGAASVAAEAALKELRK
jgi:TolA-binding protein